MKPLKRYFHGLMLATLLTTTISCEDFALGEKFLQKPPSSDVTIDTIFLRPNMHAVYYGIVMGIYLIAFSQAIPIPIRLGCIMAFWTG